MLIDVARGNGHAADHERRGEGPRLRSVVADVLHGHARLLSDLALDGGFDRFAMVDESGEAGIHPRGPALLASEEDASLVLDEHDDDGVGARKVLDGALRATPHETGVLRLAGCAAGGAELVARVPVD